jgi:glutaredoxin 3
MSDVKLYSTPTCPYCRMAKDWLEEQKIEFDVVDVSENDQAARYMINKSGQLGVPVMEVENTFIVGFERGAYSKALEEAGVLAKKS